MGVQTNFLMLCETGTGRVEDDAEEEDLELGSLAPPSVVAIIGEPGPLRCVLPRVRRRACPA